MFMYNKKDNIFNTGDLIWIANDKTLSADPFQAEVLIAVSNEQTKNTGKHYVVLVVTSIDDYVDIREDDQCWRTREQFETEQKRLKAENERIKKEVSLTINKTYDRRF